VHLPRLGICLALLLGSLDAQAAPLPAGPLHVLLPDADNLQYSAFWTAKGAGYLEAEGVQVDVVAPEIPAQTIARMIAGDAPVAVLPPPVYLQLIADRVPIVLVANLLKNDPINLVVRRSVFEKHMMSATAPLRDRLTSLEGLRVCVAPGPPARLRALFASVGLDADRDVKIVVRRGPEQNDAFAEKRVDALYAHTPYLEKAIDDQDAVMLVNQSGGEVPELAMRQIHALVVRREFLDQHRDTVVAMVRAIARAERLFQTDPSAAEDAVMRALPALERRHVHTLLGIYRPAIPPTPQVGTEGLATALALFPSSRTAPTLDGVPLADFVASDLLASPAPIAPPVAPVVARPRRWLGIEVAGAVLVVLGALFALSRRRGTA
jgi:ABC-type nitrate/sulfonate/bicarbonate transport system substrate-binding protein